MGGGTRMCLDPPPPFFHRGIERGCSLRIVLSAHTSEAYRRGDGDFRVVRCGERRGGRWSRRRQRAREARA